MRPIRAAATALVASLALSACNGGDDPADPTSTWTPSGTIDAPSTSPPTASLTEAPEDETARQFIRRWVELGNQMQATGDTSAFLAVAGPDCDSCQKFADQISAIYGDGGYIQGGTERILSLKPDSRTQWVVTIDSVPTKYVERDGAKPKTLPGGKYKSRLYLAHINGRWIVGATEGVPL